MVCVHTNKSPPIINCVSVIFNPTRHKLRSTWLLMSHQMKNLLTIKQFNLMIATTSRLFWHRPLTCLATTQSFKRGSQWLGWQTTSYESYAMNGLTLHPLYMSTVYLTVHVQSYFLAFIFYSSYLPFPFFERISRNHICYHHQNVATVKD